MTRKKILFCCPAMSRLARRVTLAGGINRGEIAWEEFDDGWPNTLVQDAAGIKNCDAYFLASFSKPGDIFSQLSVLCALPQLGVGTLTVFLPFFSTGTMDRVSKPGEIVTAMTLARLLDAIPNARFGRTRVIIYDIHALQEQFYFHQILPQLETAIPLLTEQLEKITATGTEVAVCYPDEGAAKRFGSSFPGYHQIICGKIREGEKRIVRIKDGDPRGRHTVIVDDMGMTCGTIIECGKALKAAGGELVSAFVSHGVFPKDSWRYIAGIIHFENFWLTDSCPAADKIDGKHFFSSLSLAPLIRNIILADAGD